MAKVLVVDDNEAILQAMEALLELDDHETTLCQSGNVALEKLAQGYRPDVILLDVLLSGVDGRDVCKQIKSQPDIQEIPIIMISAHPSSRDSVTQVGANGFIAKPFQIHEVLDIISKYATGSP